MKKLLFSLLAFVAAMNMNAQVLQLNTEALGLSGDLSDVAAGRVWGKIGDTQFSNPFVTKHKAVDCKGNNNFNRVIIDGNTITTANGIQGNDNPKDADGGNPALTLMPAASGAVVQIDAAQDGWIYIVSKISSNKQYVVFEDGTAIGYKLAMEINDSRFANNKINLEIKGEGEFNHILEGRQIQWVVREALGDVGAATAGNGLGVLYFPVHKGSTYYAHATGSKISWSGAYFSPIEAASVKVANDDDELTLVDLPLGSLSASDVTVPQGGKEVLEVSLENEGRSYGGFQFELKLPAGISATKIEQTERLTAIDDYTLNMNLTDAENNIYTVLGYNMSHKNISGSTGPIANITLKSDGTQTVNDVLEGGIQNVVVSTVSAYNVDLEGSNFNITIGEPLIVVLDETSTVAPVAKEGVDVIVKRSLKGGQWSTICLPFAMTAEQLATAFGDDMEVKNFTSWSSEKDAGGNVVGITIGFSTVTAMEANHPYLIKVSNAISAEDGFTVSEVDIDPEEEPVVQVGTKMKERGFFYGTYVANTEVPEYNLFVSNDKFYYSNGNTKMKAFRGYFELADVLTSVEDASARINIMDGDATGITEMRTIRSAKNDTFYDLSGRKVENPGKGLYITNNKKVIIK